MQFTKRTICFHLADDTIHYLKQVLLPLAHQHTNLAMSKGVVQYANEVVPLMIRIAASIHSFNCFIS